MRTIGRRRIGEQYKQRVRINEVERMIVNGETRQWWMALQLNVTDMTISNDVKIIRTRWAKTDEKTGKQRLARRIKQLEKRIQEASDDYEISKWRVFGCKHCKGFGYIPKQNACPVCDGEGEIAERKPGDATYLRVMKECIVECAKLQGLYPDVKRDRSSGFAEDRSIVNVFLNAPDNEVLAAKMALDRLRLSAQSNGRPEVVEARLIESGEQGRGTDEALEEEPQTIPKGNGG